jgi:hypothetical protein
MANCKNKPQLNFIVDTVKTDTMTVNNFNEEEKGFLSWDYDKAIKKLGTPISRDSFKMEGLSEFRVELYNYLPKDSDIVVKELTWRVDLVTNLTIWYIQKDSSWNFVHFSRWHKDAQF